MNQNATRSQAGRLTVLSLIRWALAFSVSGALVGLAIGVFSGETAAIANSTRLSILFANAVGFAAVLSARFVLPRYAAFPPVVSIPLAVLTLLAGGAFGSALVIYADPVFILYQGRMAAIVIVIDSFLAVIVGLIVYNFERMRDEIERTYRELAANRVREERLRELAARSELKALKAQINPHFLFNALNSISALTTIDPEAAQGTLERLASIFRKTLLASEKGSVLLSSELELVDAYLDVERARFGDRLRVEQEVAPGAGDVSVPPLILQPIVENAVRHGISPKVEGGVVRIAASVKDGRLTVLVSDDGVGAEKLELAELSPESYGLRNVRDRLRTTFGAGEWLTVESELGVGTSVRLVIPLTTMERSEA